MSDQQTKEISPFQSFKMTMEGNMRGELAKLLGPTGDVDRFIRVALTAVQVNEDLLYADRKSLFVSCVKAAQDRLLPDGREAVFNVYNTKQTEKQGNRNVEVWVPTVQYLPMVRGLIKVMRSSGEIASIDAAAVYDKDEFKFTRGDDPRIIHEPFGGDDDPGAVIASYCIVKLKNGEIHREVMWRRDIEKTRAASKSGNGANSPWTKWYDQMAIKAVIKRAAKLLPNTPELDRVLDNDNDASGFVFDERDEERNRSDADSQGPMAGSNPPVETQPAALTDERVEQEQRRPSRMANIMNRAKQADAVPANNGTPPWEEQAA